MVVLRAVAGCTQGSSRLYSGQQPVVLDEELGLLDGLPAARCVVEPAEEGARVRAGRVRVCACVCARVPHQFLSDSAVCVCVCVSVCVCVCVCV